MAAKTAKRGSIERRFIPRARTELRAKGDEAGKKIGGVAAVVNSSSEDLGGFIEEIAPGALADALSRSDPRCLFNHNPDHILGRMSAGTLRAEETEQGLEYECDLPGSPIGETVYSAIDRGDVTGNSFSFITADDRWENKNGVVKRTILKFEEIFDLGPVTFPAYEETTVSARSLERAQELSAPEQRAKCPDRSMEMMPDDTPWKKPTLSDFTDQQWDDLGESEKRRIAGCYAVADEMPPAKFESLHLPHHDPESGKVVKRGVTNAAARLPQMSLSDTMRGEAEAHLGRHYKDMGMTPPWEGDRSRWGAYAALSRAVADAGAEHVPATARELEELRSTLFPETAEPDPGATSDSARNELSLLEAELEVLEVGG